MSNEHFSLQAEIAELENILRTIPEEKAISRLSFESRLEEARSRLAELGEPVVKEKLQLTFRGQPVDGTSGILADFGGKAVEVFSSAVSTVMASINGDIGERGPVAKKDADKLMITGTAVGSFGFELEVAGNSNPLFEEDDVTAGGVVEIIQDLLETAATGTDDEITEVVDVIHPRALKKVSEFLGFLESQKASCGISFKGKSFKFSNNSQLSNAALKLKDQNVKERPVEFEGKFVGFLPHSRMFEFSIRETGEIIKGKIGSKKIDIEQLSDNFLKAPVGVTLNSVSVGEGKPKYTLTSASDIRAKAGGGSQPPLTQE
ncbi:hypothetical protein SAMN05216571_101271 [Onishia taeanensis]|uniref:Uncharacterized protein n=1 Tax=Onishia taeanensis TaxID=284577 RepID=A0A1G7N7X3_9GAMM|nr:hypothetical protein [Halomonas taeanensis]SDF69987.1 hypothetical protein SAMN05216571_101271 [Halomonas taeanensis]